MYVCTYVCMCFMVTFQGLERRKKSVNSTLESKVMIVNINNLSFPSAFLENDPNIVLSFVDGESETYTKQHLRGQWKQYCVIFACLPHLGNMISGFFFIRGSNFEKYHRC